MDKSLKVSLRQNRLAARTLAFGALAGERGFSLSEVLIIMAVFTIVAGFTIPMLSNSVNNWQLTGDARAIATSLTTAKLTSTAQMNHYQLSFVMGQNQWHLNRFNKTSNAYETQATYGLSKGVKFKSPSSSAPEAFPVASSAQITFNSRGIPIDATTGFPTANNVVYLTNTVHDFAITVSLSGKVQIWKHKDGAWTAQ